jgi:hypothetical protein
MTHATPTPSPVPGNGAGTATLNPAELTSLPPVSGGQSDVFGDVLRAGLDPAGAFGSAFALHRAVGNPAINDTLGRWAGRTPESGAPQTAPQTSLDGSAGSPMDGNPTVQAPAPGQPDPAATPDPATTPDPAATPDPVTQPAATTPDPGATPDPAAKPTPAPGAAAAPEASSAAGEEAAREAKRSMGRIFAEDGLKAAAREGGVLAAKRGAALGSRLAASTLLRLGALSVPGLGTGITVALWFIDTDGRKAFNNLIASVIGGGSEAPAIDAAPEPPRTHFLPLTHDGNRDSVIEKKDHGMYRTNTAAFGYNPDDVWPTADPAVQTTSDFADVAHRVNAFNTKLTQVVEDLTNAYQSAPDEQYVVHSWAATKPGVDALAEFQSSQLPAIGTQLMSGATSANNAYQAFRDVNLKNRQEINNSTSGLIPFTANHVNEGHMSDSTGELKTAVDDMGRAASTLASAADVFTIKPNRTNADTTSSVEPDQPAPAAPPADPLPTPMPGGPGALPPAAAAPTADDPAKDLASLLRNGGLPQGGFPGGGMPGGMPQIPGLGGMPQMPGGLGGPKGLGDDKPIDKDALQKAIDDKNKPSDDAKKAPGDPVLPNQAPPIGGPAAPADHKGQPAEATPAGNPASNTTDIGGRKWTFDNPKLAALAHNLTGTDGAGHKSVAQAASEAGFKLPPPGQDVGENVPVDQIKPGDVIMGSNNHNGVFLGVVDGQAMALTESGEVKPLSEVAQFDGPHQGFFRLADDGAPPAGAAPVQTASVAAPAPPPAPIPPAPAAGDPGVLPGQATGTPGLNPGQVPPNN